jgi:outer membrane protein OmpA-like peptidoglycan-associated protein
MFLAPSVALAQGTVTFGGGASAAGGASADTSASAAAPAARAGEALEPPSDKEKEWAERDRLLNESQTLTGGVGLLRTQHAQSGAPGQFRLAFTTEYFSAGFLCTSDYPCTNPRGAGKITSDSLDHIGGTIGVTATILPWLEGYATTGAFANSDAANRPSLLQVLGDTDFGLKAFGGLSKVFFVGGAMELWLVNGTGSVGLDGSGTGAKFRGLATADLRGMESHVPLRFSMNLTYSVDNSGDVLTSTETARGTSVTRIERFGLNVNRVDHFDVALGGEYFVADERVRPFIEYTLMAPVNRQGYLCKPSNPSGDKCLANEQVAPSKLTLGGRFFPWKHGFGLLAALDIGVTGTGTFIEEVSPTPPWTLFLGASWGIDTWDRPPVEKVKMIEKRVEGPPKAHAFVHGIVHEKDKEGGIPNAIVAWANHPEWTAMATGPDGKFNSHELLDGEYKFSVKADGYKDGECAATIAQQKDVNVDCALEANPRNGTVVGHVRDAATNAPLANATVRASGSDGREIRVQTDAQGAFRLDPVQLGPIQVTADADGYMSAVVPADVKPRQDTAAEIQIQKRPKNPLVQVQGKEITIKQQVQFALDSATILPASNALLTEIADVINKNPSIKKIEVQGHTDNSGTVEHNRQLSEERAAAVRDWLTSHGVSGDRLISKGYGDTKPIAPNVTEAMKARNRRVQFIILEQDKGANPATPPKPNAPLPVPMPF